MIKLHCFGESGNAYKAALALQLAGLDWEPVFVDFFGGATRGEAWRAMNGMAEVPVLELDDGTRLSQSGAIQQWVAARTGRFAGRDADRFEILRWQFWDNHKLSSQAGAVRFMRNFLPEDQRARQAPTIAWLQGRLGAAYDTLNRHLAGRDWIVGDGPTMADLSCCGYLYYPEPFGFARSDFANIDAWLGRLAELPGWAHPYDLMPPARPENQPDNRKGRP